MACVENMAAGLPIIITNSGGMPEYAGKKCSIIVEKDANLQYSLAKQIKDLIENKDKRKAMGRYAELEATNYSITNMYNEFYKTLKLKVEKIMKSIRIKPKECVFVIFALLCGVSKLYPFTISTYWTYTLACLWIIWSYNYKKEDGNRILAKLHLRLFVVPIIVMCFYTIIIWFVSSPSGIGGEIEYYSRLFSNTIF